MRNEDERSERKKNPENKLYGEDDGRCTEKKNDWIKNIGKEMESIVVYMRVNKQYERQEETHHMDRE